MFTVNILINGNCILARSAVNQGKLLGGKDGELAYKVDTGQIVYHNPVEGTVALVRKLLNTIEEEK